MPNPPRIDQASTSRLVWPRLGVLAAVVLWGTSFVFTKAVLTEISPLALITFRSALGSALLAGLLVLRRQPLLPPRDTWWVLAGMGFVGVAFHQLLQAYGLTLTSAMNTGWLIGLIPIWSAILARIFQRERMGPAKVAGLGLGFAGALLLITRGRLSGHVIGLPTTRGDLLILASTLNWAVYSILGHGTIRRLGPTRATAGAMVLGWLMLVPLFLLREGWRELADLSLSGWGALLFLGVGCSGLGYLFWFGALERIETSRVAAFLYLEPLVTLAAASLLLGEVVRPLTVLGGLLVLAGVVVVERAPTAGVSGKDAGNLDEAEPGR